MKFTDNLEKLPQGTYKILVNIAWSEIEAAKEKALKELQKTTEVKGFRKGKAPLNLVKKEVGEQKLLEEASKFFLSEIYAAVLKKHALKPFIDPKITLLKAPVGGEWEVRFEIAEAPVLTKLPDYKKIAEEIKADLKKADIWVPGKDSKEKKQDSNISKNKKLQRIFDRLVKEAEIDISPLILDQEINRRLVALYEDIKKLGLTVEQYLQSKKETTESLRKRVAQEIVDIYKSEFILDKIADVEKIVVDEKDLEKIFKTTKDEKEKQILKENSYFYSRLIRKQKVLDFISNL